MAPEAASLPIDYMSSTCTTGEAAERFNKEEAHLRRELRDALAFAIALNRTLVLPRMLTLTPTPTPALTLTLTLTFHPHLVTRCCRACCATATTSGRR